MKRLICSLMLLACIPVFAQIGRYEVVPLNFSVVRTNGVTTYTNKQAIVGRVVAWSLWSNLNTTGTITTAAGLGLTGSARNVLPALALTASNRVTGVIASNYYMAGDAFVGSAANANTSVVLEVRGSLIVEK